MTLNSDPVSRIIVAFAFEEEILDFVCGCVLGLQSVTYHVCVTVNPTSDLVSRIFIDSCAYPITLRQESQI